VNKHKTGKLSKVTKGQLIFLAVILFFFIILVLIMRNYVQRAMQVGGIRDATPEEIAQYGLLDEEKQIQYYPYYHTFVEEIIDGKTIKIRMGDKVEKVRLIGIDVPEVQPNDKAHRDAERTGQDIETINKMGQEATEFIKGLIKQGQEVRLEFDVQEKDRSGRLLAYVYIPVFGRNWLQIDEKGIPTIHRPDGIVALPVAENFEQDAMKGVFPVFLNAFIVQQGYATPITIPPNVKYANFFKKLFQEAREQKSGFWRNEEIAEAFYWSLFSAGIGPPPRLRKSQKELSGIGEEVIIDYWDNGMTKKYIYYNNGKLMHERYLDENGNINFQDTYDSDSFDE
jgi:micrococcal nuclease